MLLIFLFQPDYCIAINNNLIWVKHKPEYISRLPLRGKHSGIVHCFSTEFQRDVQNIIFVNCTILVYLPFSDGMTQNLPNVNCFHQTVRGEGLEK
jgi:hypothetical protein